MSRWHVATTSSVQPLTISSFECIFITMIMRKYLIFKQGYCNKEWNNKVIWKCNLTWPPLYCSFLHLAVIMFNIGVVKCDLSMSELICICLQMNEDFKWFGCISLGISSRLRLWHTFTVLRTLIRKTASLLV